LAYSAVTALPISALHLFYFYSSARFHVYLVALCLIIGGIGIACLVPERWREHKWSSMGAVAALVVALALMKPHALEPSMRRRAADLIHASTPDDAVIISGVEPVYLAAVAPPRSRRTYLAASRQVEFASKVLVKTRMDRGLANPRSPRDHAASGLLAHGGRWAVAHTADEMHDEIEAWVRAGRPVYFETAFLTGPEDAPRVLGASLVLEKPAAQLTRIIAAK